MVKVGEGSFAVVLKGTRKETGETVAVKCIDKSSLDEADLKALLQEVQILKELDHPNIVKLYDFYEEEDFFYVVLEFVAGGELFERIVEKSYYSEEEARNVIRILCDALKYCHGKNVAHRYILTYYT